MSRELLVVQRQHGFEKWQYLTRVPVTDVARTSSAIARILREHPVFRREQMAFVLLEDDGKAKRIANVESSGVIVFKKPVPFGHRDMQLRRR